MLVEMSKMFEIVVEVMVDGVFGFFIGFEYVLVFYLMFDEIVEFVCVVVEYGGVYMIYMCDEGLGLLCLIEEMIYVVEEVGLLVLINYYMIFGVSNFGCSFESLVLIDVVCDCGIEIMYDFYFYIGLFDVFVDCYFVVGVCWWF